MTGLTSGGKSRLLRKKEKWNGQKGCSLKEKGKEASKGFEEFFEGTLETKGDFEERKLGGNWETLGILEIF